MLLRLALLFGVHLETADALDKAQAVTPLHNMLRPSEELALKPARSDRLRSFRAGSARVDHRYR